MRIQVDDQQRTYQYQKNDQVIPFILLGENGTTDNEEVLAKIFHNRVEPVEKFWGTLGYANNSRYQWSGHIECSGDGNRESAGITLREIEELYELHERISESGERVIERYIDLDHLEFLDFPEKVETEKIPELRLTIFLGQDEGAEVYLQHYTDPGDDADVEYLLCEPTAGMETHQRDRLTYNIPIFPRKKLTSFGNGTKWLIQSGLEEMERFVVKILTFKREPSVNSHNLLDRAINRVIGKRFRVSLYDVESNSFDEILTPQSIDSSKKTLLLIHGTLSSIDGSFNGLLKESFKGRESWLKYLIESQDIGIGQVIGVDHDTLTKTAIENADQFIEFLNGEVQFEHPVSLMSTSRGGLVIKSICGKYKDILPVDRVITVACANYCGFFVTKGSRSKRKRGVSYAVTALIKMMIGSKWSLITKFLSTQSYEFILSLPGLQSMTKGSEVQKEIQNFKPDPSTVFYPIVGKQKSRNWFFGTLGATAKFLFINRLLGRDHDWVLGSKQQFLMPGGNLAAPFLDKEYEDIMINVQIHMLYLNADKTALRDREWGDDVKEMVEDYLG